MCESMREYECVNARMYESGCGRMVLCVTGRDSSPVARSISPYAARGAMYESVYEKVYESVCVCVRYV